MKQLTETQIKMLGSAHLSPDLPSPSEKVKCWVAPVVVDDKGDAKTLTELADYGMDIYDLLNTAGRRWASEYDRIAFYTVGWASPNDGNDETPPSQHPDRKRVALLCVVTSIGGFHSAMFMWDNPECPEMMIQDDGQGALKEMAMSLYEK